MIGWAVNAPFIIVMLWSIIEKFSETKMIAEAFRTWNLRPYMTTLAAVELAYWCCTCFPVRCASASFCCAAFWAVPWR